jgi:hypothetical protein
MDTAKPSPSLSGAAVVIASFGANKTNSLLVIMTLEIERAFPKTVLKGEQEWRTFYSEQKKQSTKATHILCLGALFLTWLLFFNAVFFWAVLEVGILCFSQSLEKLGKSPKTGRFQDSFQIARGHIPILKYRRR